MNNDAVKYLKQYKELHSKEVFIDNKIINSMNKAPLKNYLNSISNCMECSLGKTRKNIVLGYGNSEADIVFVGEAPGKEEDLQGLPFVGRSGKL